MTTTTTTTTTKPLLYPIAAALAEQAHEGQRRRHGAPYIGHPRAVTAIAGDLAHVVGLDFDDAERAIAILHDSIEDNAAFTEASLAAQVGVDVAHQVQLLSKSGKGEAAVVAYYDRLRAEASTTTKLIKVADRLHNLSELHKDHNDNKLDEYVAETERFLLPLADSIDDGVVRSGLRAALFDAIANARRNGDVAAGRVPGVADARGLYAIVQPSPTWTARLDGVLRGGAVRVQLRVKPADGLTDRQWLAHLEEAAGMAAAFGVVVVVNDRADLAFAARRHGHSNIGLHVGDSDLPPADARALLGDASTIGTSTHSVEQLLAVEADGQAHGGADHLALGPIHASPTKQGHAAVVGLPALRDAAARAHTPIVAIGGLVDAVSAAEVVAAGATFACAVSAFAGHGGEDDGELAWRQARRFALACAAAAGVRDVVDAG